VNKLLQQHLAQPDRDPTHSTAPLHEQDDPYAFWREKDLYERRIVSDRADLHRKQKEQGFPRPLKAKQAQGSISLFRQVDVRRWLDANLKPFDPALLIRTSRPRGRPRKHPRSEEEHQTVAE